MCRWKLKKSKGLSSPRKNIISILTFFSGMLFFVINKIPFFSHGFVTFDKVECTENAIADVSFKFNLQGNAPNCDTRIFSNNLNRLIASSVKSKGYQKKLFIFFIKMLSTGFTLRVYIPRYC